MAISDALLLLFASNSEDVSLMGFVFATYCPPGFFLCSSFQADAAFQAADLDEQFILAATSSVWLSGACAGFDKLRGVMAARLYKTRQE